MCEHQRVLVCALVPLALLLLLETGAAVAAAPPCDLSRSSIALDLPGSQSPATIPAGYSVLLQLFEPGTTAAVSMIANATGSASVYAAITDADGTLPTDGDVTDTLLPVPTIRGYDLVQPAGKSTTCMATAVDFAFSDFASVQAVEPTPTGSPAEALCPAKSYVGLFADCPPEAGAAGCVVHYGVLQTACGEIPQPAEGDVGCTLDVPTEAAAFSISGAGPGAPSVVVATVDGVLGQIDAILFSFNSSAPANAYLTNGETLVQLTSSGPVKPVDADPVDCMLSPAAGFKLPVVACDNPGWWIQMNCTTKCSIAYTYQYVGTGVPKCSAVTPSPSPTSRSTTPGKATTPAPVAVVGGGGLGSGSSVSRSIASLSWLLVFAMMLMVVV